MAGGNHIGGFDLNELYQKAFGISMPEYKLEAPQQETNLRQMGKFGTPLYAYNFHNSMYHFLPIWFDIDGFNEDGSEKDYRLPYPIMRIQSQKKIVETPLTDRKGSVVELINQESWKIYIKGFIISKDNTYPEEEIYALKNIYERNEPLIMRSVLSDLFLTEKDKVVIKSLNFPEIKGIETVKPYEMELITDGIFDLSFNPAQLS
jgi:Domain of unknown function (DUF6046)